MAKDRTIVAAGFVTHRWRQILDPFTPQSSK